MKTKYLISALVVLAFLYTCKSCQSCSRQRQIDWNQMEYVANLDSIDSINRNLQAQNVKLEDSIKILHTEIRALRELNGSVNASLEHARQTNKALIKNQNK